MTPKPDIFFFFFIPSLYAESLVFEKGFSSTKEKKVQGGKNVLIFQFWSHQNYRCRGKTSEGKLGLTFLHGCWGSELGS